MTDKTNVLILAAELGYFRAKSAEKKNAISEELFTEFNKIESVNMSDILDILNEETAKRAETYRKREAAKVLKAQAEAQKPISAGAESGVEHIIKAQPSRVYVITTAQNNTDVSKTFLDILNNYCKVNSALLMVGKTTYNKGAFAQPEVNDDSLWYDPAITEYLVSGHIEITPNLHFFADANVIPTAKNPLSGFAGLTGAGVDIIIPATKLSLQCVASLKGSRGKVMHSTGAVTLRNYILRKAGAVAQTEHNISALVVEINNEGSHNIRQLELVKGANHIYDEGIAYYADGYSKEAHAAALQFGDIHAEKMTLENQQKLGTLISKYRPSNVLIHDVLDFSSRNHHNIKDPVFIFKMHEKGETVRCDIQTVTRVLDYITKTILSYNSASLVHIIESNHDLAINTWLKNADFKTDPVNATVYLQCMLALYKHIEDNPDEEFNMLEFAYNEIGCGYCGDYIQFHKTDESVIIAGVEMGCHGHSGVNGARGSPQGFRTLGVPMNTGHTHTPSICGAVYTAGVSASLEMGYNVGPSSWHLAHVLTWPNGQRQIIFA